MFSLVVGIASIIVATVILCAGILASFYEEDSGGGISVVYFGAGAIMLTAGVLLAITRPI